MRILGLTGDIACGKSTVAKMLQSKGVAALDSDRLVHELYADRAFSRKVQSLFEEPILDAVGNVDRTQLSALVFANAEALRELEALVFPAVAALRSSKLRSLAKEGHKVVVVEAVKLLESGQGSICECIWCVVCATEVQLKRLREDRGMDEAQAGSRLLHQPSREAKLSLAGQTPLVWIENNGTLADLDALVERQWKRFSE